MPNFKKIGGGPWKNGQKSDDLTGNDPEMRMLQWMRGVTKLDKMRNERIRGTTKVGEESPGKEVEVVWERDEKRGTLRTRMEGDSTGAKEKRKT